MELLHRRCCGLDVHKETVVACLRLVAVADVAIGATMELGRSWRTLLLLMMLLLRPRGDGELRGRFETHGRRLKYGLDRWAAAFKPPILACSAYPNSRRRRVVTGFRNGL